MNLKTTLLAAALLASSLAHADGSFTTLPFIATSLSGNGQVASGPNTAQTETFVWSAATGLSTSMGPGTYSNDQVAQPVSWDGSRIANTMLGKDGFYHAAYYTVATGQWTQMSGGLGGTPIAGNTYGTVFAMSGNGKMIGGYGLSAGGQGQGYKNAALWNTDTGAAIQLGAVGTFTRVNALSYDGKVAAGRLGNLGAVVWTDFDGDGVYAQTSVAGASVFQSVSTDGQWAVGGSTRYNVLTQQLTTIPKLNATWSADAFDITADGKTIVGFETNMTTGARQGFIWQDGIGTLSLDTYLAAHGVDLGNTFEFRVPAGISDDGLTFAGFGTINGAAGADTGFIATISAVPEPASYALLMAGLGAVGFMARRRSTAA